jgi:NitT/TauT family transport system substrate-binding protein
MQQPRVALKVGSLQLVAEAGVYAALANGYFEAEGLAIELVPFRNAADLTPPLATGEISFASSPVDPGIFNAIQRGIALKIVGYNAILGPGDRSAGWLVRQDLIDSGRYREFADLRGMTISVLSPGGIGQMWVDRVLARGGLTLDDAQYVNVGFPELPVAFANRAVDAAFLVEPFVTVAESRGVARMVLGSGDIYPGLAAMVMFMSPVAAREPDLGQRFVTAYLRGQRDYYRALLQNAGGREQMIETLLQYTPLRDPALVERAATHRVEPNGEMPPGSLDELQGYFLRYGSQQQRVDLAQVIDPSYAEQAVSRLGRVAP